MAHELLLTKEYNTLASLQRSVEHYTNRPGYEKLLESAKKAVVHSERIIRIMSTALPTIPAKNYNDFTTNIHNQLNELR